MTVKELAKIGDWKISGDIDDCEMDGCIGNAEKYAQVGKETWFFCKTHFAEYLQECNRLYNDPLNLLGGDHE